MRAAIFGVIASLTFTGITSGTGISAAEPAAHTTPARSAAEVVMPAMTVAERSRALRTPVRWAACGADLRGNALQCAKINVPLDHLRPDGPTITLGLTRLKLPTASDAVVFFNGGGPGIPGGALLRASMAPVPDAVARRFTIVGIDPRGLGTSERLECLNSEFVQRTLEAFSIPGRTSTALRRDYRTMRSIGRTCVNEGGSLARHISSEANARDIEAVRIALAQPTLNYIGVSYGSYLGAVYSHLFPDSVGRMVLGSVVHPGRTWTHLVRGQVRGFEGSVRRWAAGCDRRSTCPFGSRPAYRRLLGLIADLNSEPVVMNGQQVTGITLALGLRDQAFFGSGMRSIDRLLRAVINARRDASARVGAPAFNEVDSVVAVQWATRCNDWPAVPTTFAEWTALRGRWSRTFPVFGALWSALSVPCTSWPDRPHAPLPLTQVTRAVPLLIAGEHDPATPLAGAEAMRSLFPAARLVRWSGRGHGAVESGDCDRILTSYIARGVLPDTGARC
jgi:pimeloyl-ACP methyl ester carboxylesterase